METQSGIWFCDVRRSQNLRRPLESWYTPDGLQDLNRLDIDEAEKKLDEIGFSFDFPIRYTETWFKTKRAARQAEAEKRKELKKPRILSETQTDMAFLDLVNLRLDHVKAYNSERHYTDHIYLARRWTKIWGKLKCKEITTGMIQAYLIKRSQKTSPYTANKELRYLRSLFNFGIKPKRGWIQFNPTKGIEFFPVEKRVRYVPPKEDVLKVLLAADPEIQDYLWTIALTMGRMSEVNRLKWDDVDLKNRTIILYTRKKRGGHLTPRKVPMSERLFQIMTARNLKRDTSKPWVFWHRYWSQKSKKWVSGPYCYLPQYKEEIESRDLQAKVTDGIGVGKFTR